jgi:hypothetical protein
MPSSCMLRRVDLVRTDVSEESVAYIIRVITIGELGTEIFPRSVLQLLITANVPSSLILFALMLETTGSSETSVLTTATQRHISHDRILHRHILRYKPFPPPPPSIVEACTTLSLSLLVMTMTRRCRSILAAQWPSQSTRSVGVLVLWHKTRRQ